MREPGFTEVQRFRVKWAWAAVIALNGLFLYAIVQQLILNIPFGSKPAPDAALISFGLIPFFLLMLLILIRLDTCINDEGIRYRLFPFQLKTTFIAWHELRDAYLRDYQSYYEYGGWGIRYGKHETGMAINTSQSGKTGLQLVFNNGKRLLIGTRYPEKIRPILENALAEGSINRKV